MSDVINNPVTNVNKAATNPDSQWKLLLGVCALVTMGALLTLINAISSVSEYLTDFINPS